jgi:putative Mg2+ transporter-C (MgtC) family protein
VDTLTFATGIGTAFFLGAAVGVERELRGHHEAGLRTNSLVAGGAALFVSLSQLVDHEASPTRVAGQVVSGIGFLAGGVIIRDGLSIRGLTTAATLWCCAAVGVLSGSGFLIPAVIGVVAVLALQLLMRPAKMRLEAWLKTHARAEAETGYHLRVVCGVGHEPTVRAKVLDAVRGQDSLTVRGLHGEPGSRAGERVVTAEFHIPEEADVLVEGIVAGLLVMEGVFSAGWHRINERPSS